MRVLYVTGYNIKKKDTMSLGGFVRRTGYLVNDYVKNPDGARIHPQWRDIERTLSSYGCGWADVEQSLQNCLDYATANSPFYKQYAGRPLSGFPVMSKLDFINNYEAVRSPQYKGAKLHVSSTSGSTGTPFKVLQDAAKRNRVLAELQYWGGESGYKSHEKMLFYRACHKVSFWSSFWSNVYQPNIASLSPDRMDLFYRLQSKRDVRGILAYASTLDNLLKHWTGKGYEGNDKIRAVFAGSEILTDETRALAKRFWPKANIVSRYSNMENGILGQDDGTPGEFTLNWASYYFEILKFDSDEPAADGELGRIVITDMYNKAFPIIRYDNGDVGAMVRQEGSWPKLVNLGGRKVDMIFSTSGHVCSPHMVTNIMWGVGGGVRQWQFIQETPKDYLIKYTASAPEEARKALEEKCGMMRQFLGGDAIIRLENVDEIPVLRSGKRKPIVSLLK